MKDHYAYVAVGTGGLVVYDVAPPTAPRLVTRMINLERPDVRAIAINDQLACLGSEGYVFFVDLSDPTSPLTWSKAKIPGLGHGVELTDGLASVAAYNISSDSTQVLLFDVSDPRDPRISSTLSIHGFVSSLKIHANYLYLPAADLTVVNIADRQNPVIVSKHSTQSAISNVTIQNDLAYLSRNDGLEIVDISNPANPIRKGFYKTQAHAGSVSLAGNLGLIALDATPSLEVIDLTNPTAPTRVARYSDKYPSNFWYVVSDGDYAYMTAPNYGLEILDIRAITRPTFVWNHRPSSYPILLTSTGNKIAFDQGKLCVVDLSEPRLTVHEQSGQANAPERINYLHFDGSKLYRRTSLETQVYDSKDLRKMTQAYVFPPGSRAISAGTDLTCVLDAAGLLRVFNMSDPFNPIESGGVVTGESIGTPVSMHLAERYAFLNGDSGTRWYSVVDPTAPIFLGQFSSDFPITDVQVRDTVAFAVGGSLGLRIYDISDLGNPIVVSEFPAVGYFTEIALRENFVYLKDPQNGIFVVDISELRKPLLVARYNGKASGMAIADEQLVVAQDNLGLLFLPLPKELRVSVRKEGKEPALLRLRIEQIPSAQTVIQRSTDLTSGVWVNIITNKAPQNSFEVTDQAPVTKAFYRVAQW